MSDATRFRELEPTSIRAATASIPPELRASPQFVSDLLSAEAGRTVVVKVETANPIGSFKGRGTWLAMQQLAKTGRVGAGRPVVVASTGNFGQGSAYAGRALGVPVRVYAAEEANALKLARIRALGAEIVQVGKDFDESLLAARAFAAETGAFSLVDGEDATVAAGAGTMAVEVTDAVERGELPRIESAYVPVGNGALIAGVGAWLRHAAPACRVVGVQAEGAPALTLSWRAKRLIETDQAATYAQGIATRVPFQEGMDMMEGRVDEMLLVSEDDLHAAQATLTKALGITVEGASAASWAGVLADRGTGAALIIITGCNAEGTSLV